MVKSTTAGFCLLFSICGSAQQPSLSLEKAFSLGEKNYPLIRQHDLIRQTEALTISNLSSNLYPQLQLSGQATYQSDVTRINLPIPGIKIPAISKDQYKVVAEADQILYDGGLTHVQKQVEHASALVESDKVAVQFHDLKSRISQLYLTIIYENELLYQNQLVIGNLQIGIDKLKPQIENGVALRSSLQLLQVQLLQIRQRSIEIQATRRGVLNALSVLLNQPVDERTQFSDPLVSVAFDTVLTRPEIDLYNSQATLLQQQQQLVNARNLPKVQAFLQGGYGRPGLNLLSNEFEPFYIGGVRLTWNIGSLYNARRDKQLININEKTVGVQKDVFIRNTQSQLAQQKADIDRYDSLLKADNEIIQLQKQITEVSKAQLENRVITVNDYLTQVNAEDQARQAQLIHRIQWLQAQITYNITSGKL